MLSFFCGLFPYKQIVVWGVTVLVSFCFLLRSNVQALHDTSFPLLKTVSIQMYFSYSFVTTFSRLQITTICYGNWEMKVSKRKVGKPKQKSTFFVTICTDLKQNKKGSSAFCRKIYVVAQSDSPPPQLKKSISFFSRRVFCNCVCNCFVLCGVATRTSLSRFL